MRCGCIVLQCCETLKCIFETERTKVEMHSAFFYKTKPLNFSDSKISLIAKIFINYSSDGA